MSFTRKSIADHLDSYDDEIATLQEGKRETLADYRQQLADAGMSKGGIKAEIEALKVAMRRRRAIAKKGEEVVEEADVLADEIFAEITSRAPRATRVREDIEEFDPETGEVIEDQPETATEFHPPVTTREGHQGDPSPTLGETDLAEVGTGQKRAVLPQEPYTATNHQSTGVLPAGGSSPSASEIDEIAEPAQTSSPEPSTAGEGALPSSPAIVSDEEVVPAFMKGKPGCLKLRDGHCKIGFATEALCAECADKRARAMA
jgi:hypothetical protein